MGFATRGLVTVPVVCHKPFARLATSIASILHDRSLSSVARDESRMARDKPRMTGDYCRPEESIPRCVRTHSHLYSYIYGLVALLDYIQSSFSIITIWTPIPCAHSCRYSAKKSTQSIVSQTDNRKLDRGKSEYWPRDDIYMPAMDTTISL